jgi:TatD DNase family protein
MTEFVDTHCHLFWEDFEDDLDDVLARARAEGVTRVVVPATTLDTMREAEAIAREFADVWFTAGVHPHDAGALPADYLASIERAAGHEKAVAIGEIGLDYYYDFCAPDVQRRVLGEQLDLARRLALPVVIHNREADDDIVEVCRAHQDGSLGGQFHCFSSGADVARRVLDLGFHISFTGNVTFKKVDLDEVIRLVPDDRLLLETDAPFMTPVPFRGKRNEPMHVPRIAAYIAAVRGCSLEHLAAVTTANARRLYKL